MSGQDGVVTGWSHWPPGPQTGGADELLTAWSPRRRNLVSASGVLFFGCLGLQSNQIFM